ncbi:hypothetical protein H6G41_32650 [Tolypothrix sp. FACHB-123]|uniref:hypothetical protein n=1 Tax=Tolypothrix sp. FACHB-123 TaxID=2692868 RepID=UPI00168678B7|nr:hypothetical protein [Tolypothrix sp. FACHB-123]MBD2359282.1 hypothetical protein [Tolypothrix sp. FACHB-123]
MLDSTEKATFLSDGEESIHELQYYLNPHAEQILDCYDMERVIIWLIEVLTPGKFRVT